jgi:hypothetical protein
MDVVIVIIIGLSKMFSVQNRIVQKVEETEEKKKKNEERRTK